MYRLLLFLLFILSISANGQITYDGPESGSILEGLTLNTSDFTSLPQIQQKYTYTIEPQISNNFQEINFSDSSFPEMKYYNLETVENNFADSVILFSSFEGIPQTNYIPPDDYIAAGPNHLVMVVNDLFRIYDKEGNEQKTISAAEWYSNIVAGAAPVDPKILYDHFDRRWVMVWIYINHTELRAYYLISVSDDDDPNGKWFNWALPSNVNGSTPSDNWADYEGVGFDDKAIYITSNQFTFSSVYNYVKLRIISKSEIYINSNPGIVKWKDIWNITVPGNSNSASYLRPARMYDADNNFYLFYLPNAGGNFCGVYKLENATTNPVLTAEAIPVNQFALAPDASQLGGTALIESGGSALRNEPVFQNNILHAVHSIRNPEKDSLSALHYLAIDLEHNVVRKDIAMGDDKHFFFYPALAVDIDNNVIISYSRSAANEYVGGFFTVVDGKSGIPTKSITLVRGNAYYEKDFGTGRNRWGDYSGAWIDPLDRKSFWICSEFVESLNNWGTWIGGIKYEDFIPVSVESDYIISEFSLSQNYPNPFNPSTRIKYQIPDVISIPPGREKNLFISIKVYNVLGREIATLVNEEKPAGEYEVDFDASKCSSGIYFYKLQSGNFTSVKKMILLK